MAVVVVVVVVVAAVAVAVAVAAAAAVVAAAGVAEVVAAVLSSMRTVPASLAGLNGPAVLKKRAAKRIHMA